MNKKSLWAIGFLFVLVVGLCAKSLFLQEHYKLATPDQIANIEKMNEHNKILARPKCDGYVVANMGDYSFKIERNERASVKTADGKILDLLDHRCDIHSVENVTGFRNNVISIAKGANIFSKWEEKVDLEKKNALEINSSNGVVTYKNYNSRLLLIIDAKDTLAHSPVEILCSGPEKSRIGYCNARYVHKIGFYVGFQVRDGLKNSQYIEENTRILEYIDKHLVKKQE